MTRDEIELRIERLEAQLKWANGEYADQLEQDLKFYRRALAPCDCDSTFGLVCYRHRTRGD